MSQKITMYELVAREADPEKQVGHSPYVWKTKSDFAILGIPFTSVPMTFAQIRSTLEEKTGNKAVSVPTIEVGGEYVTDSFKIAEWLEKTHTERNIFHSADGRGLARFLSFWADTVMAVELRNLVRPFYYALAKGDDTSQDYFCKNKAAGDLKGLQDSLQSIKVQDATCDAVAAHARGVMGLFEKYLAAAPLGGPFLLGKDATHADSTVFGWYVSSQVNEAIDELFWKHKDLPLTGKWVEAMKGATGFKDVKFVYAEKP